MSEKRNATMLRRLPVILAVTAASYGLAVPGPQAARLAAGLGAKSSGSAATAADAPARTTDNGR